MGVAALTALVAGCSSDSTNKQCSVQSPSRMRAPASALAAASCPTLTGTPWSPAVSGASSANHTGARTETRQVLSPVAGAVIGLSDSYLGHEISVQIPMSADLGSGGSLTLSAQISGFPSSYAGTAYPVLTSLVDSNGKEWVRLADGCSSGKIFNCSSGSSCGSGPSCGANPDCSVGSASVFGDRGNWMQHQVMDLTGADWSGPWPSVNTFPTCNWTPHAGGSGSYPNDPGCAFNSSGLFTNGDHLPSGGNYTAKYALLASNYASIPAGVTATLNVTAIKKSGTSNAGGALDINVILVGTKNIQDSRTAIGQRNLNTLFTEVYNLYNQSSTGIKLGAINAYEWTCDLGGDGYASVDLAQLGNLFADGSTLMPGSTEGKAVNVFLVSTINDGSSGGLTVLGLAGGIGGSPFNGTPASGAAFASFDELATFNTGGTAPAPNPCTGSICTQDQQDAEFQDLAVTIAHEMGHYLGLNHPSEMYGTSHDGVPDTPVCTHTSTYYGWLTATSCQSSLDPNVFPPTGKTCNQACPGYAPASGNFCPAAAECQFNHIMWWTGKNTKVGTTNADGNLFSSDSAQILNYSPFVQ